MRVAGSILIILGVLALAYHGLRFTFQEKVLEVGPLAVTASKKRPVPVRPILGGVAIGAGVVLVLTERRKK